MLESLIVIIPTALAYCYALRSAKSRQEKLGMVMLFFAMCTLWMHFYAQSVKWFGPTYPYWLSVLRAYTSSLAQPLAFLVVLQAIGKSHNNISTYVLFSFVLINLIQYGALSLDSVPTTEKIDLNNICFLYGGKVIYRIPNYCAVMVLQGIWIFSRTLTLDKMVRKHNYHSSREAMIVLQLLFVMIISVLACAILPDRFWESDIMKYGFFIYFAIGFTVLLTMIGKNFILSPILDSHREPVYFDRKPRFDELKRKCDKLYNEDKIFLIPSLRIEDIAQKLGTNSVYATELMKNYYNASFAAYTNSRRIEVAKETILTHPNKKFEDVAHECGFANVPTFTKVFKGVTGYTPSAWVAKNQQEEVSV